MSALLGRKNVDFTEDSVSGSRGGQYMSFEKGTGKEGGEKREVAMRQYTINPDNMLTFYGRKNYLSSFYEAPMLIAGHLYPTVEHYYEACKVYAMAGPYNAMHLKGAQDPGQVKSISKKIIASQAKSKKDVERWKRRDGLLVLRVGLMEKFRQNPKLRSQLFKTGDAILVQCNQYDTFWSTGLDNASFDQWMAEHKGQGIDVPALIESYTLKNVPEVGKGKNLLGFILMYVRECLRSEYGMVGSAGKGEAMES